MYKCTYDVLYDIINVVKYDHKAYIKTIYNVYVVVQSDNIGFRAVFIPHCVTLIFLQVYYLFSVTYICTFFF